MTAAMIVGCGDKPASTTTGTKPPKSGSMDGGSKTSSSGEKTPVEGKGVATIKGKITYDGTPPTPKSFKEAMGAVPQDKAVCLAGNTNDPLWIVGADKGIANVVVWVQA